MMENILQTALSGARLNFLQLPLAVHKLMNTLEAKTENPIEPS